MHLPWNRVRLHLSHELILLAGRLDKLETETRSTLDLDNLKTTVRDLAVRVAETTDLLNKAADSVHTQDSDIKAYGAHQQMNAIAIANLEDTSKKLTIAVAEGIERVERYERRIRKTVSRAKKELAEQGVEHSGLEAEDTELRLLDGEGGNKVPMLPVRGVVESTEDAASSVKGVSVGALRRARGF